MAESDSAERRAALTRHVRAEIGAGALPADAPLPGLRELGERFGLSRSSVQSALKPLIAEGVLISRPRRGVFVSRAPGPPERHFLFASGIRPESLATLHLEMVRQGFERQISRLGGATVVRWSDQHEPVDQAPIPPDLAGAFHALAPRGQASLPAPAGTPCVRAGYLSDNPGGNADHVHFNDLDGGRLATQQLIAQGHSRIAFIGAHMLERTAGQKWSEERECGWRSAMTNAFPDADLLSFHPTPDDRAGKRPIPEIAVRIARRLVADRDHFDALVGADDSYLQGVIRVWQDSGVPRDEWPAMVGFEGLPAARSYVLTSIVPNWERLGETAASLLWRRATGALTGPPVQHPVAMNVVFRSHTR